MTDAKNTLTGDAPMPDDAVDAFLGNHVKPGHDVASLRYADKEQKFPDGTAIRRLDVRFQQQIAELTDAIDRLQARVAELERREPW